MSQKQYCYSPGASFINANKLISSNFDIFQTPINLQYCLDMIEILALAAGHMPAASAKVLIISRQYCRFYWCLKYFKI